MPNRALWGALPLLFVAACSAKHDVIASAVPATPAALTAGGPDTSMMAPDPNDSPATKGYKAAMMKMMSDGPKGFTGNPDVDFMANMRVHHQAAIDMAAVELERGADPAVKNLARDITSAQKREITIMNAWLKQKGQ